MLPWLESWLVQCSTGCNDHQPRKNLAFSNDSFKTDKPCGSDEVDKLWKGNKIGPLSETKMFSRLCRCVSYISWKYNENAGSCTNEDRTSELRHACLSHNQQKLSKAVRNTSTTTAGS